jgi:glycosyltransferase involved in cell wall biosynthesis
MTILRNGRWDGTRGSWVDPEDRHSHRGLAPPEAWPPVTLRLGEAPIDARECDAIGRHWRPMVSWSCHLPCSDPYAGRGPPQLSALPLVESRRVLRESPRQAKLEIKLTPMVVMCRPAVSVVAPCFDEEDALPLFLSRVGGVLDSLGATSEVVLVDDGSRDQTWGVIEKAAVEDPRIVGVRLMRNHGHQLALTAGLSVCRGDRVLIIDADLQDPPELLPEMMALMDEGADVVYGQRRRREGESLLKRATAALFYRLIGRMAEVDIPSDTGDFRLITRRVLDLLIAMPERHRFIRGLVSWIGGKQVPLVYDRDARAAGKSKYPFAKMVRFAADAITSFSMVPLRLSVLLGWIMAAVGFAGVINSLHGALTGQTVPGWASLMAGIGLLSGTQFLMLGIIGAYLGRLYEQSKGRPLFLIRDMVGGPEASVAAEEPASSPLPPPPRPSA